MSFWDKLAQWLQGVLLPLGGWGLLPAAFLDSSFLTVPGGVDLWLITLCALAPSRMPLYVAVATAGSLAGCSALYWATRKGRELLVEKGRGRPRLPLIRQQVETYGPLALLVAALLPPPTPFKLFILAAGAVKQSFPKFLAALLVGRLIRYSVEGVLAVRYGRQVWEWLLRSGPWVLAALVLAAALAVVAARLRRKRSAGHR